MVFDANGDGLKSPITVGIYDRTTQSAVSPLLVLSGATDPLINGSRFRSLANAVNLGTGQDSVVASNYGNAELNGKAGRVANGAASCFGSNAFTPSTTNGAGLINFVGGGRYGAAGAFPATADSGPLNRYLAGTFEFEAATPEPATCGFVGMGLAGLAFVSRRRKA